MMKGEIERMGNEIRVKDSLSLLLSVGIDKWTALHLVLNPFSRVQRVCELAKTARNRPGFVIKALGKGGA